MTVYNAIPDSDIDGDSPGKTTSVFKYLRDNPIAIAEGNSTVKIQTAAIATGAVTAAKVAAGAATETKIATGAVTESKLGASSVSTAKLKTSIATAGEKILAGAGDNYEVASSSRYIFYPRVWCTAGTSYSARIALGASNSTGQALVYLQNNDASDRFVFADFKYITASPPYDLGDGEVGLFMYAVVESSGRVTAIRASDDPPWACLENRETVYRDGKKYYRVRKPTISLEHARATGKMSAYLESLRRPEFEEFEATAQSKNRAMHRKPHPFGDRSRTGKIVMLDPVSEISHQMRMMLQEGEPVAELLVSDFIEIAGEVHRAGPPGVPVVGVRWRSTRG